MPQQEWNRRYYLKNKDEISARKRQDYIERGDEIRARQRKLQRERNLILKREVLTHYGRDKCGCVKCGESRLACLSIDHINGGGTRHMKLTGIGNHFYKWLKEGNYPEGYQTLCMNCQFIKRVENNEGISQ